MKIRMYACRLAAAISLLCRAKLAIAQPQIERQLAADALFEEGKAALAEGNWTTGCALFDQSQQLDPSASTLIKIARCHEHDMRYGAALSDYDQALALIRLRPESDEHAAKLKTLVLSAKGALELRRGTLLLRLVPPPKHFQLKIDGEAIEPTAISSPIALDPGPHHIAVTAANYQSTPLELTLAEGEFRQLTLELRSATPRQIAPPLPSPAIQPKSPTGVTPSTISSGSERQILTIGSVSTGGVLLGLAGYYAIRTRRLVNDARLKEYCNSKYECDARGAELLDDAKRAQTTGIVLGSAGALLAGLGLVLWTTATTQGRSSKLPNVALLVAPSEALLGGRW